MHGSGMIDFWWHLSKGTPNTLSHTLLCATGKVRKDIVSIAIWPITRAYLQSSLKEVQLVIRVSDGDNTIVTLTSNLILTSLVHTACRRDQQLLIYMTILQPSTKTSNSGGLSQSSLAEVRLQLDK